MTFANQLKCINSGTFRSSAVELWQLSWQLLTSDCYLTFGINPMLKKVMLKKKLVLSHSRELLIKLGLMTLIFKFKRMLYGFGCFFLQWFNSSFFLSHCRFNTDEWTQLSAVRQWYLSNDRKRMTAVYSVDNRVQFIISLKFTATTTNKICTTFHVHFEYLNNWLRFKNRYCNLISG